MLLRFGSRQPNYYRVNHPQKHYRQQYVDLLQVQGMYHLCWIPALAIVLTLFFFVDFSKRKKAMTPEEIAQATREEEGEDDAKSLAS